MNEWESKTWERERWSLDFGVGLERISLLALEAKSRFCPICGKDCGSSDFEPDDPSVGIFGICWVNDCLVHGIFCTDSEGVQELEESS